MMHNEFNKKNLIPCLKFFYDLMTFFYFCVKINKIL